MANLQNSTVKMRDRLVERAINMNLDEDLVLSAKSKISLYVALAQRSSNANVEFNRAIKALLPLGLHQEMRNVATKSHKLSGTWEDDNAVYPISAYFYETGDNVMGVAIENDVKYMSIEDARNEWKRLMAKGWKN